MNRKWLAISAAARSPTVSGQSAILISLSDPEDLDFCTAYSVGFIHGQPGPEAFGTTDLADEDYSILIESAHRAKALEGNGSGIDEALSSFVSTLPIPKGDPPKDALEAITWRFSPFWAASKVRDFSALKTYVAELKARIVHICGPDVLTAVQVLIDPTVKLTRQEALSSLELLTSWGLRNATINLLLTRAVGEYPDEQEVLRDIFDECAELLTDDAAIALLGVLIDEPLADIEGTVGAKSSMDGLVYALNNVSFGIHNDSAYELYDGIVQLFELDPSIVEFLPWDKILPIIERSSALSPQAVFTTLVMGRKEVRRVSTMVAVQIGRGALIGDLKRLAQTDRTVDVITIAGAFTSLPPRAAREMTLTALHPPIFDRLAGALPPRSDIAGGLPAQTLGKTLLRIEAIRYARRLKLITEEYAQRETEREKEQAKLEYFQHKMLSGRVRIPWEAIEKSTKALTSRLPLEFLHQRLRGADQDQVVDRAAAFFSNEVSQYILFDSNFSIDQALSNNLRHGIVVPRFLRAFDDALQITAVGRRHLPDWEEEALTPHFEDDAQGLLRFRELVNAILTNFLRDHLTVVPRGTLDHVLRKRIKEIIKGYLLAPLDTSSSLEVDISEATEEILRESLSSASSALTDEIKPLLLDQLMSLRDPRRESSPLTNSYLDSLETNLHEAFEEVSRWIGVAERSDASEPFHLSDLIKLELLSSHLASWRRFKVSAVCYGNDGNETHSAIRGIYLDLFLEAVHNLVSNALKYSGMASKTEVRLELLTENGGIKIKCLNTVSPDKMEELIKQRRAIEQQARRPILSGARKDQLSGFLKIRKAFLRYFERDPEISVEASVARHRLFTVQIKMPRTPDIWNQHETNSDRRG